jgi:hypothetical protein
LDDAHTDKCNIQAGFTIETGFLGAMSDLKLGKIFLLISWDVRLGKITEKLGKH